MALRGLQTGARGEEGARMIRIVVRGTPAPQGSKSFKGMTNAGRAILTESSRKVKPWRQDVKAAAEAWRDLAGVAPIDGPIVVRMTFTLPKPKSAPKTRRTYPMRTPDLSKLARSTEDALTDAGIWTDDARVIGYSKLWKAYPGEDVDALDSPGAVIEIIEVQA
jgi:crossover junction endodeoxyribonuclease RusA